MKKLFTILCGLFLFASTLQAQDYTLRPAKVRGVPVFVMSEPVNDYEVVAEINTTLSQVFTALGSSSSADAQNIEDLCETLVRKALKKKRKKKVGDFDAIITKDGNLGMLIKFKDDSEILGRPDRIRGVPVFVMAEPVEDYEVTGEINTAANQVLNALVSESSADAANIEKLCENLVNKALRKERKGKVDDFNAIVTKIGDFGTLIKISVPVEEKEAIADSEE